MKFGDLKADDPWFVAEGTNALKQRLEELRSAALSGVVSKVRSDEAHAAAEYVGQWDAYGKVLVLIREGEDA